MPLDLHESVRMMGGFRWVELRLFDVLGRFATSVTEPVTKTMLGVHCHHHAWHAELWRERLPALRGIDPDAATAAPTPGLDAFFTLLGEPTSTLERLAGVYRVAVPRLAVTYTTLLDEIDERTDGPTARALTLMLRDDHDHWQAGERELQRKLRTGDDVATVTAHQAKLEALLVESGGFAVRPTPRPV